MSETQTVSKPKKHNHFMDNYRVYMKFSKHLNKYRDDYLSSIKAELKEADMGLTMEEKAVLYRIMVNKCAATFSGFRENLSKLDQLYLALRYESIPKKPVTPKVEAGA